MVSSQNGYRRDAHPPGLSLVRQILAFSTLDPLPNSTSASNLLFISCHFTSHYFFNLLPPSIRIVHLNKHHRNEDKDASGLASLWSAALVSNRAQLPVLEEIKLLETWGDIDGRTRGILGEVGIRAVAEVQIPAWSWARTNDKDFDPGFWELAERME